ncbi:MAG: hypothetical protein NC206_04265, partial [Bacteroides sp.]|nr:hypothetical protein [Bacteroides sp.]MCM1420867.1 hypothetical protein [Bacteroides sp.]
TRKKTILRRNFHNSLIINTSYFASNHAFYVKNRVLFAKMHLADYQQLINKTSKNQVSGLNQPPPQLLKFALFPK